MEKNLRTGQARKTGKYLKYAIGEIILVVIGILIALTINNWNEQKRNNKLEKRYLVDLISDLQKDSTQLEDFVIDLNEKVRTRPLLINGIKNGNIVKDSIKDYFSKQWEDINFFSPNKVTFEEIKNGSHLSIIRNLELRKSITSLHSDYEDLLKVEDFYKSINTELISMLKRIFPELGNPSEENIYALKDNNEVINSLELNLSTTRQRVFKKNYENCTSLLVNLRKELEQHD
jgi:hypothetical protein